MCYLNNNSNNNNNIINNNNSNSNDINDSKKKAKYDILDIAIPGGKWVSAKEGEKMKKYKENLEALKTITIVTDSLKQHQTS